MGINLKFIFRINIVNFVKPYSETLELSWNIEPNRIHKNHSNASNTPCKVIQMQ